MELSCGLQTTCTCCKPSPMWVKMIVPLASQSYVPCAGTNVPAIRSENGSVVRCEYHAKLNDRSLEYRARERASVVHRNSAASPDCGIVEREECVKGSQGYVIGEYTKSRLRSRRPAQDPHPNRPPILSDQISPGLEHKIYTNRS